MDYTIFTLRNNHCNCHPETCCCNDYAIYKGEEKFTTIFDKKRAMEIVEALNFMYNKKGSI